MIDLLRKAGRGIKRTMEKKITDCTEALSSAQNRLIVGLVMVGAGVGFIASAYMKAPTN